MLSRAAFAGVEELDRFGRQFKPAEVPVLHGGPYGADFVAESSRGLWLGVIWRAVLDLEPSWDVNAREKTAAHAWFSGPTKAHREAMEEVCAMAGVEPDALRSLYRTGRLTQLAREAIGKERWETRRANILARGDGKSGDQLGFGF